MDPLPQEEATITLRRTAPDDVQQRGIIVKVDGNRVAELKYGEGISISVASGRHTLSVDNTWNRKTIEIDLAPGETRKFLTKSRTGRFTWFLVSFLGSGPLYVSIELET
jgi:hypothetical protein